MDLDVLSALANRTSYERYSRFVKQSSLGEETWTLFSAMGEWFKNNKRATYIDWHKFGAWFSLVRAAKMSKEKLKVHKQFITILADMDADDPEMSPMIHGLAQRDYASQIGDLALRIADGEKGSFDEILTLIQEHDKLTGKIDRLDSSYMEFGAEAITESAGPGLEWRLKCLQISLGDLRKGDLVVFGKRPDAGGTTFVASEATWIAEQLNETDKQVLWINNEERGNKVTSRIVQAATGWSTQKVIQNPKGAMEEYMARMGRKDRIVVHDLPDAHIKDVNVLFERYDIGLIILDQGWKIHGFEDEGETVRQTLLSNWMRESAKKYAPVITVHQAGGEAEGMRWIPYSMLYGSKTGVPGEADAILMMGRDYDDGDSRFLWAPKNKMQTPGDFTKRNMRWEITIDPDHARFKEYV